MCGCVGREKPGWALDLSLERRIEKNNNNNNIKDTGVFVYSFVFLIYFIYFLKIQLDFSLVGIVLLFPLLDLLRSLLCYCWVALLIGGAERVRVQKVVHVLYPKTSKALLYVQRYFGE